VENLFLIGNGLEKIFFVVAPFLILLGGLIFIHELGHFLAARFFKVKVEVFSLGFGPKILKYKKGDTLYCISLLPLGGYVKMFGDNPLEEPPEDQKQHGFLYKKAHQKWLIAFAGPFFNLLFTLIAFFILGLLGRAALPPQLGDLSEGSKAFKTGFRPGDQVLAVNGQEIFYYDELDKIIQKNIGEILFFDLKDNKGERKTLSIEVERSAVADPFSWRKNKGSIDGFSLFSQGLKLGVPFDSLAYEVGLRTFDEILAVGLEGVADIEPTNATEKLKPTPIRFWRELEALPPSKKYRLKIQREGEEKSLAFQLKTAKTLLGLGLEPSDLYIEKTGADTPAQKAGLKRGDRLLSVQGKKLNQWEDLLKQVEKSEGGALELVYQRKSEARRVLLAPEKLFVEGNMKSRYMVGIVSAGQTVLAPEILKKHSIFESVIYSGTQTWKWLAIITTGLVRLVQGEFSIRTMGGPIAIGRVAHNSFSQGFSSFLFIMTLISLNLFLLNLLPIPVLDGGHLLFFSLEALLGRPLSLKKLMIAQNIGLVFILGFMGFALLNDIYNWMSAW